MRYQAAIVSKLLVRGLINQLELKDVEELVRRQFPEIDRHTLWESYNIALLAFAVGAASEPSLSGR